MNNTIGAFFGHDTIELTGSGVPGATLNVTVNGIGEPLSGAAGTVSANGSFDTGAGNVVLADNQLNTLTVTQTTASGTSQPTTLTFFVDILPPVTTWVSPATGTPVAPGSQVTLSVTSEDQPDGGSGVATVTFQVGGANVDTETTPNNAGDYTFVYTVPANATGTLSVAAFGTDNVGNVEAVTLSNTISLVVQAATTGSTSSTGSTGTTGSTGSTSSTGTTGSSSSTTGSTGTSGTTGEVVPPPVPTFPTYTNQGSQTNPFSLSGAGVPGDGIVVTVQGGSGSELGTVQADGGWTVSSIELFSNATNTINVVQSDLTSGVQSTTVTGTVTEDDVAPVSAWVSPANNTTFGNTYPPLTQVSLVANTTDNLSGVAGVVFIINPGAQVITAASSGGNQWTGIWSLPSNYGTQYTIQVQGTDNAGNVEAKSAGKEISVTVANNSQANITAPTITQINDANGNPLPDNAGDVPSTTAQTIQLGGAETDPTAFKVEVFDSNNNVVAQTAVTNPGPSGTWLVTFSGIPTNAYDSYTAVAFDTFNNSSAASPPVSIIQDILAPTTAISVPSSGQVFNLASFNAQGGVQLSGTCNDTGNGSGVVSVTVTDFDSQTGQTAIYTNGFLAASPGRHFGNIGPIGGLILTQNGGPTFGNTACSWTIPNYPEPEGEQGAVHTLSVTATDFLGNTQATATTTNFSVDTVNPPAVIDEGLVQEVPTSLGAVTIFGCADHSITTVTLETATGTVLATASTTNGTNPSNDSETALAACQSLFPSQNYGGYAFSSVAYPLSAIAGTDVNQMYQVFGVDFDGNPTTPLSTSGSFWQDNESFNDTASPITMVKGTFPNTTTDVSESTYLQPGGTNQTAFINVAVTDNIQLNYTFSDQGTASPGEAVANGSVAGSVVLTNITGGAATSVAVTCQSTSYTSTCAPTGGFQSDSVYSLQIAAGITDLSNPAIPMNADTNTYFIYTTQTAAPQVTGATPKQLATGIAASNNSFAFTTSSPLNSANNGANSVTNLANYQVWDCSLAASLAANCATTPGSFCGCTAVTPTGISWTSYVNAAPYQVNQVALSFATNALSTPYHTYLVNVSNVTDLSGNALAFPSSAAPGPVTFEWTNANVLPTSGLAVIPVNTGSSQLEATLTAGGTDPDSNPFAFWNDCNGHINLTLWDGTSGFITQQAGTASVCSSGGNDLAPRDLSVGVSTGDAPDLNVASQALYNLYATYADSTSMTSSRVTVVDMQRSNRWTYTPVTNTITPSSPALTTAPDATAKTFSAMAMVNQPSASGTASFPQIFVAYTTPGSTPGFIELYGCANLTCSSFSLMKTISIGGANPADNSDNVGTATGLLGPAMNAVSYLDPTSNSNHWVVTYSSSQSSSNGNLWVLNQEKTPGLAAQADKTDGNSDYLPSAVAYNTTTTPTLGVFFADTGLDDVFAMSGSIGPTNAPVTGFPASTELIARNAGTLNAGTRLVVASDVTGAFVSASAFYEVENTTAVFVSTSTDPTLKASSWSTPAQIDANGAPLTGTAGAEEGAQGAFMFPASSTLAGKWADFYVDINTTSGLPELVYQQEP